MTNPVYSAPLDLVTTAVLELLRSSGRVVFDGTYSPAPDLVPTNPGYAADPVTPRYPWSVLYRIPGGSTDHTPDLAETRQTIVVPYQVTAVSNLRNQCESTGRQLRDRILARNSGGFLYPLTLPTGWACTHRRPDDDLPGVDTSGAYPSLIYSQPFRFYLTLSPS